MVAAQSDLSAVDETENCGTGSSLGGGFLLMGVRKNEGRKNEGRRIRDVAKEAHSYEKSNLTSWGKRKVG